MNTPSPFGIYGLFGRQEKRRFNFRLAVVIVVCVHGLFFAGLLFQGCRRDQATNKDQADLTPKREAAPPTNPLASAPEYVQEVPPAAAPSNTFPAIAREPASTPAAPGQPPPKTQGTYTAIKGDTMARIARTYGVSVTALAKANPQIDPAKLRPGQKVQIPAGNGTAATRAADLKGPGAATNAAGAGVHVVKAGETLTRIAQQHHTTVKALQSVNHLNSTKVMVGQKLKVPPASTNRPAEPAMTAPGSKVPSVATTESTPAP